MWIIDPDRNLKLNLDFEDKIELHGQEIHFLFKNGKKVVADYSHTEGAKITYEGFLAMRAAERMDTGTPEP